MKGNFPSFNQKKGGAMHPPRKRNEKY